MNIIKKSIIFQFLLKKQHFEKHLQRCSSFKQSIRQEEDLDFAIHINKNINELVNGNIHMVFHFLFYKIYKINIS